MSRYLLLLLPLAFAGCGTIFESGSTDKAPKIIEAKATAKTPPGGADDFPGALAPATCQACAGDRAELHQFDRDFQRIVNDRHAATQDRLSRLESKEAAQSQLCPTCLGNGKTWETLPGGGKRGTRCTECGGTGRIYAAEPRMTQPSDNAGPPKPAAPEVKGYELPQVRQRGRVLGRGRLFCRGC